MKRILALTACLVLVLAFAPPSSAYGPYTLNINGTLNVKGASPVGAKVWVVVFDACGSYNTGPDSIMIINNADGSYKLTAQIDVGPTVRYFYNVYAFHEHFHFTAISPTQTFQASPPCGEETKTINLSIPGAGTSGPVPQVKNNPLPVMLSAGGPGESLTNPTTLLSALPINNTGAAPAENVEVTAIKLNGGTLTSPVPLPFNLGTIPAGGSAILNADFSGGPFTPGESYALTVKGTYAIGDVSYCFKLKSNLKIPPAAPGSSTLQTATVPSHFITGAPFPHQPRKVNPKVNTPLWTVPTAPFVYGPPTPTSTGAIPAPIVSDASTPAGSEARPILLNSPGSIVITANNGLGLTSGTTNGTASTTAEPSGGATGGGVIFATANWVAAYSTDGGNTWTQLDPTTIFPNDAVGFCCDQIVQYVPSIDRFIWLLQGSGYRLAVASPADIVSSGGTAWTYWNLTPNVFGQPAGTGLDYPDLSVGDNFLYMSWDAGIPCPTGCTSGFQVVRTSLAGLQAGGTINLGFTNPSDGPMAWGSHLTQNTLDEIFWAGHNNNSQLRVFSCAESSNSYFWRDVGISSWANNAPTSLTPDGQDWLAKNFNGPGGNSFPKNGIIGSTRSGNRLWFAWTAGTDNNFKQAHVEMVSLDPTDNFNVIQQVQIWNDDYAFAYPALARNACTGEIGLSLEYGGNGHYENHVVGIWGDFVVYVTTGSDVGTDRFGDYVTIRQAPFTSTNPGNLFNAFGYGLNATSTGGTQTDIHFVTFGRPASECLGIIE